MNELVLRYGLVAVFVALILTPLGLPIPEDVTLLAAGMLTELTDVPVRDALVVGYIGVLGGDVIGWTFGRRVGLHPTGFIARLVGPEDIERISKFYRRYGAWAIVLARQVPGMRLPAFFFAGASGVPLPRFLVIDGAAAVITVGVFVSLGRMFADDLGRVIAWLEGFRTVGGVGFAALVGFGVWRIIRRRIRRKKKREKEKNAL